MFMDFDLLFTPLNAMLEDPDQSLADLLGTGSDGGGSGSASLPGGAGSSD